MNLDLFSSVGFKAFFFFFPFIFGFYYIWMKLLVLKKSKGRVLNLKIFFLFFFSKNIKSSTSFRIFFSSYFISMMFIFMLYSKLWKLVPLTMSISSKILFTLKMGLVCWLMMKVSSVLKDFLKYFSHFTTPGCPLVLVPFMKVIEVISKLMRPITLGVRLAVNLLTGHLLLGMFSSFHSSSLIYSSITSYGMLFFGGLFMYLYELCVCLIQSLVYALMISQYFDEHS